MLKDTSMIYKIMEWIELLHILGADNIFMYLYGVPKEVMRILSYYKAKGKVDLTKWSMSGYTPAR